MSRILSNEECEKALEWLSNFERNIVDYCDALTSGINTFNTNETVQSFYASGQLGHEMEQEILKIKSVIEKYYNTIAGGAGLVPYTRGAIQSQLDLLNSSYRGGA